MTFGVAPDRPETGYGYLELSGKPDGSGAAVPLASFREKPDAATAAAFLAAGTYLWNGGIFLFRAGDVIAAFRSPCAAAPGPLPRRAGDRGRGSQPVPARRRGL